MNIKTNAKQMLSEHDTLEKSTRRLYRTYCNFIGPFHVLPDYLIIGTAKGGTTSLYEYMIKHPQIFPALTKQVHYFDKYFSRGVNWYRSTFPSKLQKIRATKKNKKFVTGEATPLYMYHPLAPQRVYNLIPNTKLIVLLRNPVERAYSRYSMELNHNNETLSFEEAIEQEPSRLEGEFEKMQKDGNYFSYHYNAHSYLTSGIYADQLERWFKYFPREQFLILSSEDFYKEPNKILNQVFQFLGIPDFNQETFSVFRKGNYSKMNPETRKKLVEFFKPHNERLYKLLGTNFHWE